MFIFVLALNEQGWTNKLSAFFWQLGMPNLAFGYSSLISSNLINNIPMSVLFTDLINLGKEVNKNAAIYASIIGSNIGAFVTPVGALAGIMFMNIVKKNDINYKFINFIFYGIIVAIPVLTVSVLLLGIF